VYTASRSRHSPLADPHLAPQANQAKPEQQWKWPSRQFDSFGVNKGADTYSLRAFSASHHAPVPEEAHTPSSSIAQQVSIETLGGMGHLVVEPNYSKLR